MYYNRNFVPCHPERSEGSGSGLRAPDSRLSSLSLSRGFTVLFIPIIHSIILYGNEQTHQNGLVTILTFIAEWPGAQLFMLLMGIHFALSKNTTFKKVILRSILLLTFAYLLNYLKFVLPEQLNILPQTFLDDIKPNNYPLIFIGDILHFASLSLPIMYIIKQLPFYPLFAFIFSIAFCFVSPVINFTPNSPLTTHLLAGQPPHTYFPLLPWLAYPLTGISIGYCIKKTGSKTFAVILPAGLGLMAVGFYCGSKEVFTSFYRTGPWLTIQHLGFVCTWLTVWHIIARLVKHNLVFTFLNFLSRNITLIYCLQWPIICWLLPVIGYHQANLTESIIIATEISILVFLITHFLSSTFKKTNPP